MIMITSYLLKGDWGNIETCPVSDEELMEKNLTIQMLTTLLHRYQNQMLEIETFSENLNALNDTIENISKEKEVGRTVSNFFTCSTFAEFLSHNLNDLEFKRQVQVQFWICIDTNV